MKGLNAEQILFIHYRLIEETGGSHGVRDTGLLQAAVHCAFAAFGGKDLYPDAFHKAAALMHSIVKNHPFIDGNKRTAITSAVILLQSNGYVLKISDKEIERFTLRAAEGKVNVESMAAWFRKKTLP